MTSPSQVQPLEESITELFLDDLSFSKTMDASDFHSLNCANFDFDYHHEFENESESSEEITSRLSGEDDISLEFQGNRLVQCQSEDASTSTRPTKVKFSTVEVRTYDITPTDFVCDDFGPGITLDWKYNPMKTVSHVEGEDEVYTRHRPVRKLVAFDRRTRLMEVANIVIPASNHDKEGLDGLSNSIENTIQFDRPSRERNFLVVVSHLFF